MDDHPHDELRTGDRAAGQSAARTPAFQGVTKRSSQGPRPTSAPHRPFATAGRLPEVRWAALATALFALGLLLHLVRGPAWLSGLLFGACYLAGGWEPALAGVRALTERVLDVDLLMIVAAIGAAAIGQVLDGGLLIVIFATSGAQEAYATRRTADSVNALLTLAPEVACRVRHDGQEDIVETATLGVGEVILVRPGERIGADGTVVAGQSEVDQASITGEPLPLLREPGDGVFAGTVNIHGALRIRVDRPAGESVVARIVELVEQASATKARTQLSIERIEQRYSVTVVATTLLLFGVPIAFGESLRPALLRAMTYMIVASPCAVVLATMPPLLAAIANAGRHGVLVKSAVVMEQLGQITLVAFDKTGTLTSGSPHVTGVHALTGLGCQQVLRLAAAAEQASEHPLGRAIVAAAASQPASSAAGSGLPPGQDFLATPGRGVQATIEGRLVQVGSPALLNDRPQGPRDEEGRAAISHVETSGQTAVVVLVDRAVVGVLALADELRPDAASTVLALTEITGAAPVLLTGDNACAAGTLAQQLGIGDIGAGLLPAGKADRVAGFQQRGKRVLVVGDGINDAPALATAHVGVAMGRHGSDLTLQTADAVLVGDDLTALPALLRLSRQARLAVLQNLTLASLTILGLISVDLFGHLPLPLGVLGHEGGTVLIGLNGLRLLHDRAWKQ